MPELNQKLDHFTSTILAQATAETTRAMEELKQRHAQAFDAAEDRVLAETYHYVHTEVARIKSEEGRKVSRHMLDVKNALYRRREEIAHEVFAEVREKLVAFAATPAYADRLLVLYGEAVDALKGGADIRVYLRPADMALSARLSATRPAVKTEFVEGVFLLGGLVAESPSLGRRLDATFDTAEAELDGHFAELFGFSLSDELNEDSEGTK